MNENNLDYKRRRSPTKCIYSRDTFDQSLEYFVIRISQYRW